MDITSQATAANEEANNISDTSGQDGATDGELVELTIEGKTVKVPMAEVLKHPQLQDYKNAYDKKIINQDKFFQKKSMQLSAAEKAANEARTKYDMGVAELTKLRESLTPRGQQAFDAVEGGDPTAQDVNVLAAQLGKFLEQKLGERLGDVDLKDIVKKVSSMEARYAEQAAETTANSTATQVKGVLDKTELDPSDKQKFLYMFAGKYDVDRMPIESGYDDNGRYREGMLDVLDKEVKAYTKELKSRGLLKNKEYVDKKLDKARRNSTDNSGTKAPDSARGDGKPESNREAKQRREKILEDVVLKHWNK